MNYNKTDLTNRLSEYLDRRSVPMNLNGKQEAQVAELDAMLRVIMRHAPQQNHVEWWNKMVDHLDMNAKTRGWPSVADLSAAAKSISGPNVRRVAEDEDRDPLEEMARRMNAGEAVGDSCFYGRMAVEMKAKGLVTEETLRKYRSALYFRTKKIYRKDGERKAEELEAHLKARHAAAEQMSRTEQRFAAPEFEPKRIAGHEWDGASA